MIYSEKYNVCVYKASPHQIVSVIPEAYIIDQDTVAVPCTLEAMRVMRKLGYEAMSPILREYNFQGLFKPYQHQLHIASFLTLHQRAFNLSDIGTGKTISTLWAADYLMEKGHIKKAVILSPLSTLQRVWQDEIFKHFLAKRSCVILHGSRERRMELLNYDADFYIINHDGLGVGSHKGHRGVSLGGLADVIKQREDINCVIIDEGSVYKDSSTVRYKVLKNVVQDKEYLWWLTGTPTPNQPTDAWSQAKLVNPSYHEGFTDFRSRSMYKITHFKWAPKKEATKVVAQVLQPSIRFNREDCIDLPPCVSVMRDVELTAPQQKALKELQDKLATHVATGAIDAVNEATLRMKLLQVSLGAIYDSAKQTHTIDCAPRIKILHEIIAETNEKLLIFAPLTSVVNLVYQELKKTYPTEKINGEIPQNKRAEVFRAFQQEDSPRIIVADPRTMAHGLTLTRASTIIWYGPTDMPEVYTQANGRINRPGQVHHTYIVRLAATNLEREIYKRLDNKEAIQGSTLDLIRKGEII